MALLLRIRAGLSDVDSSTSNTMLCLISSFKQDLKISYAASVEGSGTVSIRSTLSMKAGSCIYIQYQAERI
jgi:hypothetical protein